MQSVTISKLKNELSHFLRLVKKGQKILITDRNLPIAEILPLSPQNLFQEEWLIQLEAEGAVRRPVMTKQKHWSPPKPVPVSGVLEALLEERTTGR